MFSWAELLAELHAAGLDFHTIPVADWLRRLEQSAARGDEVRNPAVKLLEFFDENLGGSEDKGIAFETTAARRDSAALRSPPRIIEDGYVRMFLKAWLLRWGA